ncbi:hypothetical protein DH2020_047759 [Rehmannia glutinosa]|uniref:Uncharacterized protein n=1 Tax=Rehmannia glutinosa TaxID=99300 RepID=A0ABR0U7I7_REHGL
MASSSLPWHPLLPSNPQKRLFHRPNSIPIRQVATIRAFRRSDLDGFAKRVRSGELWRDAWRRANDGFEQFVYDTRKTAERIDRRYAVSRRFSEVAQSAADRARELDREFEITQKWRTFSLDFSRNWPTYRKQLSDFLDTPLGRSFATLFFLWFALSGWLFRILIFATWVLPFAGPLLIGAVANNLVIKENAQLVRGNLLDIRTKQYDVQAVEILFGNRKATFSQEAAEVVLVPLQVSTRYH